MRRHDSGRCSVALHTIDGDHNIASLRACRDPKDDLSGAPFRGIGRPLNVTVLVPCTETNPVPAMATFVPAGPDCGAMLFMLGADEAITNGNQYHD